MFLRLISASVISLFSLFADPAIAWVEGVVERTEAAVNNARCVYRGSPNDTVYLVHPPTDPKIMPDSEVRTAMLDLTDALSTTGRFQVVRGRALRIDATTRANSPEGRQEIEAALEGVTKAAVTIYVEPYQRLRDSVRVEVTLLVRSTENFRNVLTCTPSFRVDIPIIDPAGTGVDTVLEHEPTHEPDPPERPLSSCADLPRAVANNLDYASDFVRNYFDDLGKKRVLCIERKWWGPAAPKDLPEMVVRTTNTRVRYNEVDVNRSSSAQAIVVAVVDVTTTDGVTTAWRVEITVARSTKGLLIVNFDGDKM